MEWSGLFRILEQLSSKETEELVLVSPYISTGTLRDLSSSIKAKSVKILTSWNESNLIQGSSSLDYFHCARTMGGNSEYSIPYTLKSTQLQQMKCG